MEIQNEVLDAARAHFDNMRGQDIKIPEWGKPDKPLIAYFDPPTLRKRQEIQKRCGKSESRQMAFTVILCLTDKDKKPIFEDDAISLDALETQVDPAVVSRIATRILNLSPNTDLGK